MEPNPILKKLGFSSDDRLAIIHADDVGMCQASVAAFTELQEYGLVTCGAVMTPCSWFPEVARYARYHPKADLGVHLTLTSEWETYRWGPISSRDPATGLLDSDGYFFRRSQDVQEHADPQAVAAEIEAQVQRAKTAGISISHVDTHMGAVAHPKFMQSYLQIALAHRVALLMFRMDEAQWQQFSSSHIGSLDDDSIQYLIRMTQTLETMNIPLLDHLTGLPLNSDPALRLEHAKSAFRQLPAGVTHFIIHPSKDSAELRAITPDWACRVADYQTFQSDELHRYLQEIGVHRIGYRQLQQLM